MTTLQLSIFRQFAIFFFILSILYTLYLHYLVAGGTVDREIQYLDIIKEERNSRLLSAYKSDKETLILDVNLDRPDVILESILHNHGHAVKVFNNSVLYDIIASKKGEANNSENEKLLDYLQTRIIVDHQLERTIKQEQHNNITNKGINLDNIPNRTQVSLAINQEQVSTLRDSNNKDNVSSQNRENNIQLPSSTRRTHFIMKNTDTLENKRCDNLQCVQGCPIYLQGFSANDAEQQGRIMVNNELAYNWTRTAGLFVALVLPDTCKVKDVFRFDCHLSSQTFLAFLLSVPRDSVLVGVSAGNSIRDIAFAAQFIYEKLGIWMVPDGTDILAFWAVTEQKNMGNWVVVPEGEGPLQWSVDIPFGPALEKLVNVTMNPHPYEILRKQNPSVSAGGRYEPMDCEPAWRVAIIIPYRDRDTHLRIFLANMLPFLQKQMISFQIFVIHQAKPEVFNRAALMNIGYLEASKLGHFDCFVFHDVDLLPENLCNLYRCGINPRHLSVAVDKFAYQLPYDGIFGGATILTPAHMKAINGFPNVFFGWGGEDDNISGRIVNARLKVDRYPAFVGRYKMLFHGADKSNPASSRTYEECKEHIRYTHLDGLNTTNYKLLSIDEQPLHTKINVQIPGPLTYDEVITYFRAAKAIFYHIMYPNANETSYYQSTNDRRVETLAPQARRRILPSMMKKNSSFVDYFKNRPTPIPANHQRV